MSAAPQDEMIFMEPPGQGWGGRRDKIRGGHRGRKYEGSKTHMYVVHSGRWLMAKKNKQQ